MDHHHKAAAKRVAIVGAGTSGLAACKHLLARGLRPVVFEAGPTVGGLWTRTLASTRLQSHAAGYRFSDFPWPEDADAFPRHGQVVDYLAAYARRFAVDACFTFRSHVVSAEFVGDDGEQWARNGEAFGEEEGAGLWRLTVRHGESNDTQVRACRNLAQVHEIDFLSLCIGRFSGVPNIPAFPPGGGPDAFRGRVVHSMDLSNMDDADAAALVKGKRVAVVGSGKSAFDIAAEVAKVNVFRTKHWLVHKSSIWGIDLGYFYLNRISQLLLHKPGEGFLHYLLAAAWSPLRWAMSKVIETYFKWSVPLQKHGMVPDYSFSFAMSSCSIAMLPEGFYDRVDEGSIILKKSKAFNFSNDAIILQDRNESIKSDIVILATGFRGDQKLRDIFTANWCRKIVAGSPDTSAPLYRECIHPRIPQLAIVGYTESLTNLYASERMANWVAHFLAGGFKLPSITCMEKSVAEWAKYKNIYNGKYFHKSCISTLNIRLNDLLCQDIGCNSKRKNGFLAEWFQPYGPADYAGLY
ncbi:hypothetical protein HU200_033980 [Digitaria exilis]|uniref:Flavin-containing monooxygenase n=1 Tax=Digitaria exilis TaxID=1010633 RepID=A0A835BJR7_9POAL|nr:hypothetical protein HU200_033980 [Digitaria exilis]